jgi:molybdate transport system permease protein
MRPRVLSLLASLVVLAVAGPLAAPAAPERTVVVSAAVSLSEALEAAARQVERRTGMRVSLNFGASNSLARQIVAGAPVDLFISADEAQMQVLEAAGRIAPGTRVDLLRNRLVVVVPAGRGSPVHSPSDLLSPAIRRIAIGDPSAVPAGVYAREYFRRLGLWDALSPEAVPGASVRAALAAIDAGEADAAVVYATDARMTRHAVVAFEVPADSAPPILYPAALVAGAAHAREAAEFLRALQDPATMAIFEGFGFARAQHALPSGAAAGSSRQATGEPPVDWWALWVIGRFTVVVAFAATALMLPPAILVAWVLARGRFVGKVILETLVSLPLVLPPVATGLILLRLLGRRGPFGALLEHGGVDIVFTWKAVVLAMACMGFPLVVRTARAGFEQVTRRYEQVAETLGAGPARVFFTVSLPLASRNVLAGALLGFSRALGEFGATIVVAGSLPGRTRTLAVAIFSYLETGQDAPATILLSVSIVIAFGAVWVSNLLVKGQG